MKRYIPTNHIARLSIRMMATDPRRRKLRHLLTPENLSTCIQVTNLPNDWTSDTVTSVIAGSGRIIDINIKNDPRSGKLAYINYEYVSSRECQDAFELLSKIDKFPCKLEKIIPSNYKERIEEMEKGVIKPSLELNRDSYPWSYNLELPFQMVTAIPIPRRPMATSSSSNANKDAGIVFPDILSKASQHLPPFNETLLRMEDDKISMNLSKIPPLQLIEMLSNLKILANQGLSKKDQLGQFLQVNDNLIIAISQSLLEMGFFTEEVVTNVLKTINLGDVTSSSNSPSISNTPSQSYDNIHTNPTPSVSATDNNNLPPNSPPPAVFQPYNAAAPTQASAPPTSNNGMSINETKLQALPQNQQDMIRQVLTLTDEQLSQLPVDQQTMVQNLRKDYLI